MTMTETTRILSNIRTYSELMTRDSFLDRFRYLKLGGSVGKDTFGFDRYMAEELYWSKEWHRVRNEVIIRDSGCDLGMPNWTIPGAIYVHHMNPLVPDDIKNSTDFLLNPEYLICCSFTVHQAIHYGDEKAIRKFLGMYDPVERKLNDTCPWR